MTSAHDFEHQTIDGKPCSLAEYKGKVLLIVNVASQCGLTPQYKGLEELYRDKKNEGFVVLGFPCNQFGGQEPGTESEIQQFCSTRFDVTFPLFAKLEVNGKNRHPLYEWLTSQAAEADGSRDIKWNFAKFLIGRDGQVVARFGPTTAPTAETVVDAVQRALAA
jgi:glutathione peroxidase